MNFNLNLPKVCRLALGLVFLVFGVNGFLDLFPMPIPGGEAGVFLAALGSTGYFFPLLKVVEIAAGAMLLSNRAVPLALLLLAPVVVNIFAFHVFMDHSGLAFASVLLAAELYMLRENRNTLMPLLT